ncbi:hypothetical protein F5146DRAFT_1059091 [Armillaria mellea]|nr:hypothetical protein F5146DRAFT_1059091 [Armillaria mellea]
MTILLTGGTGQTATRIANLLKEPVLLTSRKGVAPHPFKGVKFDWYDPSTYENPFTADPTIDRVYLVAPPGTLEVLPPMKAFIDLALEKGVKRFVLLTGTSKLEEYPLMVYKVHEYLVSLNVDYAVLRPSWFFENFLTWHLRSIKEKNTIISASADGKVGFICADDIADLAVSALTDEKSHNTDHIIMGPELLTYDEVAALFTEILGRKITHTRITIEELKQRYISFGLPPDFATMLSSLENRNISGVEEEVFKGSKKVTGKRTLRSFIEANKDRF